MSECFGPEELRTSVRTVLSTQCAAEAVRAQYDADGWLFDDAWQRICALGWLGLGIDEASGGLGGDCTDTAIVHEEIGRHLAPLPLLATSLCLQGLALCDRGDEVGRLLEMGAPACVALDSTHIRVRTESVGDEILLHGEVEFVLDGMDAGRLLVSVDEGAQLVLVNVGENGLLPQPLPGWDKTRRLAHFSFDRLRLPAAQLLASGERAQRIHAILLGRAHLALAADAIGGADQALALTLDYLKVRHQFGRPIGSFQALKHRCADLAVGLESARALLRRALRAERTDEDDWQVLAALAKARAADTWREIAGEAVQMHGGMGFTWEHDAHFHLKRANLDRMLFGDAASIHDDVAMRLFGG